jgi:hypothetical protein
LTVSITVLSLIAIIITVAVAVLIAVAILVAIISTVRKIDLDYARSIVLLLLYYN